MRQEQQMLGQIDHASDRAVFRQIADHLGDAIRRGELRPGDKLPSESELMEHYGVARLTVRQGLQVLQAEGLTDPQHGKGVFVRDRPAVVRLTSDRFARAHREAGLGAFATEMTRLGRTPRQEVREVAEIAPPGFVAERLGLRKRERVVVRRRRMFADDVPMQLADSYIPAKIARGTALLQPDSGPGGTYARIEEKGHTLTRAREELAARMPSPEERKLLQLGPGLPVVSLVRTAYDSHDVPVEVFDSVVPSDRYVFAYDVPMN